MQLKPGTELQNGKYRIIKTLGQGGFGITYEAVHALSNHTVAMKEFFMKDVCNRDSETSRVSVPSVGSQALVDKFRRKFIKEAQMIWGLDHPNIVRVTDVFEENDTAYYVMENLPGGSLSDKVKRAGRLPEAMAEKYIRQVAEALAYIHSQNTVHLDVKPSNILLNAKGEAVLIDFGISKHYDEAGEQTSSTPVGISKGYAPLEQGREGDVSQFRPSTDIYALGATLYYLVSGKVPPEASIVYEDGLIRPSGLSDRLWKAIEQAMQPRRKDRPQTVAAFLSLLSAASVPSSAPAASESATEETEIVSKPTPKPKPTPQSQVMPSPAPAPKPSSAPAPSFSSVKKPYKTWLWALLGGVVVAAVIAAIILGGRKDKSVPADSLPLVDTITVETPAATETPPAAALAEKPTTGSINGHEWVDLGLPSGLKWATCNVGASSPSDYGNYYAWGETAPKRDYSWSSLKYCTDSSGDHFSKYVPSGKAEYWGGSGNPDNKKKLDKSDDAARSNWGGSWRMPTVVEWAELRDECSWTWTTQGGKNGHKVTSKINGNSIFIPAAGCRDEGSLSQAGSCCYYWSSSLYSGYPDGAWSVYFDSVEVDRSSYLRFYGFSVRPVSE